MIIIGIDPGVNTGYAEWNAAHQRFATLQTLSIHQAMDCVQSVIIDNGIASVRVVFEDARMRGNSGAKSAAMAQGAGSVKRDCKIWDDFLTDFGISWQAVSPKAKGAKVGAEYFRKLTGWEGRTSQHARDAGMIVYGLKK